MRAPFKYFDIINMNAWLQFFLSAILGGVAEICYLLTSYIIDTTGLVSHAVSNFLGLLVDVFLDYFLQSLIFLGSGQFRFQTASKFLLYRILDTFVRQILYVYALKRPFIQKYLAGEKKRDKDNNVPKFLWHRQTHLRYIIVLLVFFVLTFPMRKYWIFT